ncbi:hypothetical Protein YC6258_04773 [Gynuella sunshinyii YC6258]|uniref:Uncharacterized protein n=1 Tax=Gynuella sunshinyii YC6258 TaxID=1445510 RepID=A0A0C5VBV0_9GAMM|nr:hypothetical Protein YC6258_04773 [Gynuella sunshinyii YC6258]
MLYLSLQGHICDESEMGCIRYCFPAVCNRPANLIVMVDDGHKVTDRKTLIY